MCVIVIIETTRTAIKTCNYGLVIPDQPRRASRQTTISKSRKSCFTDDRAFEFDEINQIDLPHRNNYFYSSF